MFIQTESTPNPNSLKFILTDHELCEKPIEFNKSQNNRNSVLADELFKIKGVDNINELDNIQFHDDDLKVVNMINSILSSKIRPAIMQDGGDVKFIKYESGTAYLSLKGSCAGCPSATVTLKNGIENMLKHNVPEVKKVEQVI